MPAIRYTAEVRQQAIARALDPHTTIVQVAGEFGCSLDTINRWLREHRQQNTPRIGSKDKTAFIPVNIIDENNVQSHPVEIVTPHGITMRLTEATPRYIAELLKVLASC